MHSAAFSAENHWRKRTNQLREGLLKRIEDLSGSDYPEPTAKEIIRFLTLFLTELAPSIDMALTEDELRFISHEIQQQGMFLQWLDNAHTAQSPRALALLLRELMNKRPPESGVVVIPQAEYNYSILDVGPHFAQLVQDWIPNSRQALFDEFKKPLKLVAFPRIERDNLLAHAIFGHELGHPIADEFLAWEEAQGHTSAPQATAHASVQKFVAELVVKNSALKTRELELTTNLTRQVLEIRKRAIQELVSDVVGALIFGPSALFAMYELLWDGSWDSPPTGDEWYPPSRLRMRVMLQVLDERGSLKSLLSCSGECVKKYLPAMDAFVQHAREIVATTSDDAAINDKAHNRIAYEWVLKSSLPLALEFVKRECKLLGYDEATAYGQLDEMIARLELGVPPNEVGAPLSPVTVDPRSPLLAAWIYKMRGIDAASDEPLSLKHVEKLHLQTLLATEYVLLRNKYDDHVTREEAARKARTTP